MKTFENDAICLLDGNRGIYWPQEFAKQYRDEILAQTGEGTLTDLLDGPCSEFYWNSWDDVLDNVTLTIAGERYYLYQDQDLFAVPEGVDMPEGF